MKFAQGKVAIILGGASTLGFACAIEFFKYGLKGIVIVDIEEGQDRVDKINQICGDHKAIFFKANAVNKNELEEAFRSTVDTFGQLDIVVNNVCSQNVHSWEHIIDVNVKGMLNGCALAIEHYLPKFKSGEEGVIVNISSIAGLCNSPINPAYSIGKLASIGMARILGCEQHYEITKVRVITVCLDTRTDIECQVSCKLFYHLTEEHTACIGVVGKGVNAALNVGNSGSIWLLADNSLTEVKYPEIEDALTTNRISLL